MSWFPGPNVMQRCYVYLFQRYFGEYFEEKLDTDQLSFHLFKGLGVLRDVRLDVQKLNETAESMNFPFEFVDGSIDEFKLKIPIRTILTESSTIDITGLRVTLQPKQQKVSAPSMFESMWSSMTSSIHLAADALGSQGLGSASAGSTQSYEGLVTFAETIDSILSRVKVRIVDAVVRLEYLPKGSSTGVGLVFNVDEITYSNESANDPPKEEDITRQEEKKAYAEQSFTVTNTCLRGVTVSTVEFSTKARNASQSLMSESSCFDKDDAFSSIIDKSNMNETEGTKTPPIFETNQDQYCSDDERSVIKCGEFSGKIELVVTVKRSEEIEGPKVSIHMDTGGLILFLSPRQMHLLAEFATGLVNPDPEDLSNTHDTKYAGKPMSAEDYARIEKDLQQQMTNPAPNFQLGFAGAHGWATGTLDGSDIDENFVPVGRFSSALYESAMSGASTMESSFTSSITSSCTDATSRTRKKMNKIDNDPTAEICKFEMHMATLDVLLLHEDLLTESLETSTRLVPSSVGQMQATSQKFFEKSSSVFQSKDYKAKNAALDVACQSNHLRLLASSLHVEYDQKATSTGFKMSGHLEATNLELSECLYQTNSDNVEHVPLITFSELKPVQFDNNTAKPNLKLIFKRLQKTSKNSKGGPKTELLLELYKSLVELDITIMDRITALLTSQTICVVNKPNNPWTNINNQSPNETDSKIEMKVTCPSMTIKLRFPVPDFRQPYDRNRIPWWKRHVRPDFMTLVLTGMSFQTSLLNPAAQDFTFRCRNLNVAYHEDANSDPVPIGKAGHEDRQMSSMQDVLMECKLVIKLCPSKRLSLEEPAQVHLDPIASSIMIGLLEDRKPNGPFSSKKVVYESDTSHHKQSSDDSKELLVPGDKAEIADFIKSTTASARIRVEVSLPIVSMQLISKRLYETIYNRINNDLLLWEPSAPRPKTTTPTYDNISYGPFGNIDVEGQEVFTLCKSGIQYDSESETDEEIEEAGSVFYSTYGSRMKMTQKQVVSESKEESYLALNVQIGRGLLCICTPVRDATTNNVIPNQQGEFLVNVENATVFMVNGYMGDMDLGYVCLELHNAQLHHCDMMSTPSHSPPLKDIGATPGKHFHPTIHGSESGMLADCKNRGGSREMLTLCVKIKASHETHHVKNVSVAAALNKATLRHRMWNPSNSWISQLIDFFNVNDYPIPGYHNNEILTELYFHCYDCAIQYNPIHLPTRAAFILGSFSISSHLSAEVNTSTLRLIFEESGMFLSQKGVKRNGIPYSGPVDLKRDYVNVVEVGLLEISLKTSDKKNLDAPHFDMRASINSLVIRTCADTARALMRLIVYYSNYGDLVPPEDGTSSGSAFSSPRHAHEQELVSVEPQEVANLSESQHQQINDLIQDALEDIDVGAPSQAKQEFYTYNGAKIFYFPDEKLPPQDQGKPLPQVTTELGRAAFEPSLVDSDDEFCFIDQEPGYNIFPKNGEPEIKWLTDEPVRIVDNHLSVPSERTDPLKTPKDFPVPVIRYTFSATILWQMYGGNDFGPPNKEKKKVIFSDEKLKDSVSFSNAQKEKVEIGSEKAKKKPWTERGGPNRDHNVLMELQLSKIRFQHEVYPETSARAARMVFLVQDIEIRDRLKASRINKFMSLYTSEARPKQSNANMLLIKALHVRPDPQLKTKECCLKISVLPLRFYIDQDALLFLISFFTELSSDGSDDDSKGGGSKHSTPVHQPPVMTVNEDNEDRLKEEMTKMVDENLLILLEENRMEEAPTDQSPQTSTNYSEDGPIYFRKVVFSPALHIVIDYEGRMSTNLKKLGSVQDIFMGFASLKFSELTLKSINHRHGLLGVDKVLTHFVKEWLSDIKKNQIPKILSGVGPMNSFVLLFQGLKDLFCLPFEQYRKDGRFFRGLHRGARSFSKSTTAALLELTDRFIAIILFAAETAFDMLTPGPSVRINPKTKSRRKRYNQPKDIREGVTNAYKLVKEGIEETADNILQVASHEHEQKGYSGAVGGVIRQIPPTIIKPIIIASEATSNVLGGVRCQLIPDARKEAVAKWRNEETYDE